MQINGLRVRRIVMPRVDLAWRTASYAASVVEGCVAEVDAEGVTGIGGTSVRPSGFTAQELEAQLNGPVRRLLIGADVGERTMIRETLRSAGIHRSAVFMADLALLDLLGKAAGVPSCALWGGAVRPGGPVVRFVGLKPPGELVAAASDMLEQGFSHLKIKLGTTVDEDVERIRVLRSTFGDRLWISVDGNGAYAVDDAIALSRGLEPYEVALIEQPINYHDLDGLVRLTATSPIPIMTDQYVNSLDRALEVCRHRAAHIVSVKIGQLGSVDECRRAAELCLAFGMRVHVGGGAQPAVVDAAQAQVAVSVPGIEEEAEVGEFLALTGDPTGGPTIRDGRFEVGSAPGLGVTLTPSEGL
ncbi:MAG: hypothetical protein GEU73_01755 [Chloroflexi bacterium]|nr:hypothetical protein [Chloroflexota bacterium]